MNKDLRELNVKPPRRFEHFKGGWTPFLKEMKANYMRKASLHSGDSHWRNCPYSFLEEHFWSEVSELNQALMEGKTREVLHELVDVANMAMMIWNRIRLDGEVGSHPSKPPAFAGLGRKREQKEVSLPLSPIGE